MKRHIPLVLIGLAAIAALAWWTHWLDPYLPALAGWRKEAQRTAVGQALTPTPEPRWETTPGRDKAACLRQSGGELNNEFMLCRSGKRELVRVAPDGQRTVLKSEAQREEEGLTRSGAR